MNYRFYVLDSMGKMTPATVRKAVPADYKATRIDGWQTDWTTPYIQNKQFDKYALVIPSTGELIGLCAYKPNARMLCANMMYMEAAPTSNPTLVKNHQKKYHGIGKVFFAFGALYSLQHGGDGSLFLKAKTTELFRHYQKDFGAKPLRHGTYDMFLFAEDAVALLNTFETED